MRFSKRFSRILISGLLVLVLGLGLWRLNTTPSQTELPSVKKQADHIGGVSNNRKNTAGALLAKPAASHSPTNVPARSARFLTPTQAMRSSTLQAVTDRWPAATVLAERSTPDSANPEVTRRIRIIKTDFKYPLLRLEETVQIDARSKTEVLTAQVAMVADHVVVKLAPGSDASLLASTVSARGGTLRSVKPAAKLYLVTFTHPLDPDGLPAALEALQSVTAVVRVAEPDFIVYTAALTPVVPNDESFSLLYGLHNTGQTGGIADADIDAPEAWAITTGSRSIRVGVIDTGIDYNHPDLAANLWTNPGEIPGNGIDDDGNGYVDDVRGWDFYNNDADPMDDAGHGTHCAGTIGASGNNANGVVGVNWQVSLVALKILGASGGTFGATSDASEAIAYATRLGLHLTSNSWGGPGYSQATYDAIAAANSAGRLFVAASGNDAADNDKWAHYPSGYNLPNVISVGATDASDQHAYFSNFGTSVHLAAPGVAILSTAAGGGYRSDSGTSMATPQVAGAAALVLARRPSLSAALLKDVLLTSADPLPALFERSLTGARLNAHKALLALDNLILAPLNGWSATGPRGGPFTPRSTTYNLSNVLSSPRAWTATSDVSWLKLSSASGTVSPGGTTTLTASLDVAIAQVSNPGTYTGRVRILDSAAGIEHVRTFTLIVTAPAIYAFDLGTDPGWPRTGEWAYGQPAGLGAYDRKNPDPSSGYTGSQVLGINLYGNYAAVPAFVPHTVTAGPFNLFGYSATRLQFRRWLNSDRENVVHCRVEISTDGTTWSQLWSNGNIREVTDEAWTLQDIDLSAAADNQPVVYLRWVHQVMNGIATARSGWNIDDIAILGYAPKTVKLNPVAPVLETAGSTSAVLKLDPAPSAPLVVSFTSSLPSLVPAPSNVAVAAGTTSLTIPINVVDNTLRDGTRSVDITPHAVGYTSRAVSLTIHDNETANLSLELPSGATEGATGMGRVLLSPTASVPITLTLGSSDSDVAYLPSSLVLPAGASSAPFTLQFPNNPRIDGSRTTIITAAVVGWSNASRPLAVADDEPRTIELTFPSTLNEGTGLFHHAGTVSVPGPLTTDLVITLTCSLPSKVTVPATVTLPAGSTSETFSVTLPDDTNLDGAQTVTLTAAANTFTSATVTASVADNDPAYGSWSTIPGTQALGVPFDATLSLYTVDGSPAFGFTGFVSVSATNTLGTATLAGAPNRLYVAYSSGTARYTVLTPGTGTRLNATVGSLAPIVSEPFTVTPGPATTFSFSPIANPQVTGRPVSVTLTARDAAGNVVPDFTGIAALSSLATSPPTGTGSLSAPIPFFTEFETSRTQAIYLASELGGARSITRLAVKALKIQNQTVNDWTIRIKPTSLTHYPATPLWENTGWTVVHKSTASLTAEGWVEFLFTTPYAYNGTDHLLIDFSFFNHTSANNALVESSPVTSQRVITYSGLSRGEGSYGDPLTWSGTAPVGILSPSLPNLRLLSEPIGGAVTPVTTGAFTAGTWTGSLTFTSPSQLLVLRAKSDQISGTSDAFTVNGPPDTDSDGLPDDWETANGLDPAANLDVNGHLGDPDCDGLPNFLEYAFNRNPNARETSPAYSLQTGTSATTGLPEVQLTYARRIHPGSLSYTLESSTDLVAWITSVPAAAALSVTPDPDGITETVVARLPVSSSRMFMRVRVSTP